MSFLSVLKRCSASVRKGSDRCDDRPASPAAVHLSYRLFLLCFVSSLVSFGVVQTGNAQGWQKTWVTNRDDGFTGALLHPSIVVDSSQALHIVFAESQGIDATGTPGTFPITFRYATNVYGGFGPTLPIASGTGTLYSSLAIDSAFTLHTLLSSAEESGTSCLRYGTRIEKNWRVDDPGTCDVRQSAPATAVDREGTLHVAYENDKAIFYRQRTPDGTWTAPLDISGNAEQDRTPSIAVAPDGTVHVIFYRWQSSSRRTLMYTSAPPGGTLFKTPEALRVMSGATTGLERPFAWPPFAPSIAVDPSGACHITFTSIFGANTDVGQILYMTDVGGSWSVPTPISGIGFYNRSSIVLTQDGDLHVAAERRDPEELDWDIVYIRNRGGNWEPEQDLTANNTDDFAPANGGRFIAARGQGLAIVYQTNEPNPESTGSGSGNEIAVLTQLLAPQPAIALSTEEINFGTMLVGQAKDTTVTITNIGAGEIASTDVPMLVNGIPHFGLTRAQPFQLGAEESDTIGIRFAPKNDGCFDEELRIRTTLGEKIVRLRGCGEIKTTSPTRHVVWLDTIGGHVGDRILLTARIHPAPMPEDTIESFTIKIAYNPRAIYPHKILSGIGAGGTIIEQNPDGSIVVEHPSGSLITDSILFQLEIEGLITGKPENLVEIVETEFGKTSDTIDTRNGLVRLTGCDIGSNVAFGRGARIGTITPFPAGDQAAITWRAPAGYAPTLRIIDPQGTVVRNRILPEGTGEEQTVFLETGTLHAGWYILELIDRAEHHATPLLITE